MGSEINANWTLLGGTCSDCACVYWWNRQFNALRGVHLDSRRSRVNLITLEGC